MKRSESRLGAAPASNPGAASAANREQPATTPAAAPASVSADSPTAVLMAQLARRLTLLQRITDSLVKSRDAIVSQNLDEVFTSACEQESLCAELRTLIASSGAGPAAARSGFPTLTPADLLRVGHLRRELADAERTLRQQARVNSALLRRCGRTAAALRNLYLSCLGTYGNPAGNLIAGAAPLSPGIAAGAKTSDSQPR